MNNRLLKSAMYIAMGMSLAAALPATVAHAASDGSLVGRLTDADNKPLADAEVTVRNPETGFSRTVKADADGYYRFPVPPGRQVRQVEATKGGTTLGKLAEVDGRPRFRHDCERHGRRDRRWKRFRSSAHASSPQST